MSEFFREHQMGVLGAALAVMASTNPHGRSDWGDRGPSQRTRDKFVKPKPLTPAKAKRKHKQQLQKQARKKSR